MEQHGLVTGHRIASQDFVGNLRELREGRRARVFFDDRYDMYPASVARDSLVLLAGRPGYDRVLDRYRVDVVLWDAHLQLAALLKLDPGWRIVHRAHGWIVAVRR
jgi:hypothetical protein